MSAKSEIGAILIEGLLEKLKEWILLCHIYKRSLYLRKLFKVLIISYILSNGKRRAKFDVDLIISMDNHNVLPEG